MVCHDDNGDWQFLDGGIVDVQDGVVVHLAHVFDNHPDLQLLADLPPNWAAERDSVEAEWRRFAWPSE